MTPIASQTLALAACFQGLDEIYRLSTLGKWLPENAEPLIKSLYVFDPDTFQDIISVDDCQPGLRHMAQIGRGQQLKPSDKQILQYLIMVQTLERQLAKDDAKLKRIYQRLVQLEPEASFSWLENTHMQRLDGLYQQTVSEMKRRVMVKGDYNHLRNDLTAARIRALLLCCIRHSMLWQQKGGSRWKMLTSAKKYYKTAATLVH